MSKRELKNPVASVQARLKRKAATDKRPYEEYLIRYGVERFLYRLSISAYVNKFILKGGLMQFAWELPSTRPTRDIDFLGTEKKDMAQFINCIANICNCSDASDGITFDTKNIRAENIVQDADYPGFRIILNAFLGKQKIHMQIDIGINDTIVPEAQPLEFPMILSSDSFNLQGYSRESQIAEKLQLMVKLDQANSRVKDYYDILMMSRVFEFNGSLLAEAVQKTFQKRKTNLVIHPLPLQIFFAELPDKQKWWVAFRKESHLEKIVPDSLAEVIRELQRFLLPICEAVTSEKKFNKSWKAGEGWE